jgi:hypothetical protein
MPRGAIRALIIIGLLILLFGRFCGLPASKIIGFAMIGAGLYFGLEPGGVLRKEEVIDRWSILIGGGQGKSGEIFNNTEHFLRRANVSDVAMERKELAPTLMKGIFGGGRRTFEVVTETGNPKLKPYQMFIGARDYGNNLDVSWYLTFKFTVWQAILSAIPFVGGMSKNSNDLDLFEEQDLRAYVTNAHHCLLEAVDKLMLDLHQDPSKIERKSKGFLGIS